MSKKDEAVSRTKYAAYRRRMAVNPDTVIDTLTYKKWKEKETEKKTAKPGK